jgi:dTDP-glucose 4,6-dehydratase
MTIIVTGGDGFIGTNFIFNWFKNNNESVVNIDMLTYASSGAIRNSAKSLDVHNYRNNICDTQKMVEIFNTHQPRAIFHFAAESHVDRSIQSGDAFIQTNIFGTYSLLKASRDYWDGLDSKSKDAFRFIHVSTDEVYGSLPFDGSLFSETTPYAPNSPYSASKAASDHLVSSYFATFGLPAIITNCSNNYGPHQHHEKFIPTIIRSLLNGTKIPVYGDGQQVRDWLHVADHCSALISAFANGIPGQKYNIGGDCEIGNLDLITMLHEIFQVQQSNCHKTPLIDAIQYVEDRLGHDRRYAIDATKIKQDTGWTPRHEIMFGLEKTVAWYIHNQTPFTNTT